MKRVALLTLAATLGQLVLPLGPFAPPAAQAGGNPFDKVPPSTIHPQPSCPPGTPSGALPVRPLPLAPPSAAPEALVCAAPPADPNLPLFHRLVRDYVTAFYAEDMTHKILYGAKIKKEVFKRPGSPEYVEDLAYLDAQSAYAPEAIHDLARSLQLHWEAIYAMGLGLRRQEVHSNTTKIGATIGMAILGASLLTKPQGAPRYFSLFRLMTRLSLPLAGGAAGSAAGRALNAAGVFEPAMPISPASVMRLGIAADELAYEGHDLETGLAALTASMAAMGIAYDVVKAVRVVSALNRAATPLKINPIALVASIAVTFAVEEGVLAGADFLQFRSLKGDLNEARLAMDRALAAGDDYRLYLQSDVFMKRAINARTYVDRDLIEAQQDYLLGVQSALETYREGTPRYQEVINTLTRELAEAVRRHQEYLEAPAVDPDYETVLLLGYLRQHDEAAIAGLGDAARRQARQIQAEFDHWLLTAELLQRNSFGPARREKLFGQFLDITARAFDRRLAGELRRNDVRRDGTHLLLQAASFLKATGKDFVGDQADALLALVARNDLLIRSATTEEAATAGLAEQDQKILEGPLPPGGAPTPSTPPQPTDPRAGGVP